jgi:hypothetical protein
MKYISKPVEIEAIQWNGNNYDEIRRFALENADIDVDSPNLDKGDQLLVWDKLQEQWIKANHGDYIIKGTKGEFYPCAEDVFVEKYTPVEQPS